MKAMTNERLLKLLEFIKEQPDDLFLRYALAMEYLGMHETQHAKTYFTEVIEKDPGYVPAYYQLGKICEGEKKEQEAIAIFEKGLEAARMKKDVKAVREIQAALDELLF
jgi:Tfp pilus assembly protein PilF